MSNHVQNEMYTSELYLTRNPGWHVEDSAWKAENIARIIEANKISFHSCVEVGCGAGYILKHLSDRYRDSEFIGYDITPQLERFWHNISDHHISFMNNDFFDTQEQYDLLLLIDVFEHVEDYLGFLNRLSSRASYFIFHIPLDMNVQNIIRDKQIELRDDVGHLHYFSKSSALRTLEDSGYAIVDWFYTAGSLEAAPSKKTKKRNIANLVRKICFPMSRDLVVKIMGGFSIMVLAVNRRAVL